ncbi:SHOCT domain-containing protein [Gordonia paraffinivorans]|uniref:SHOCT domain-containing protein n=1 Tax=Gordonia paraffinivorans TaxID=175628 RepID=UPI0024300745|nr:SHOCT domain-containing protein [Gordonia paraffinivorans]
MNASVTPEAESAIADISARYGISRDAVLAMLFAVNSGGGTMAQFNIPELGGSGQWMRGGMTMVGDMFDNSLKARVDSLCNELSNLLATIQIFPPAPAGNDAFAGSGAQTSGNWWPADLGVPSSSGAQNDLRYAVFPGTRRLAIQVAGTTRVFDTGDHQISGVQQQQGTGYGSLSFSSQYGTFDVSSLVELGADQVAGTPVAAPAPDAPAPAAEPVQGAASAPQGASDIVAAIESLADLHRRGILTDEEFAAKKAELLGRL